jgi:hypothetical protein
VTPVPALRPVAVVAEPEPATGLVVVAPSGLRVEGLTEERKEPRPGHGPREQKALPIVEVVRELDEPDQM